jgi:hypothetical protein
VLSVTLILASRPNVYSSSPLDRVGERREDTAWIEQQFHHPDTLFVPVWRSRNLIRGMDDGSPEAVFVSGEIPHTWRALGVSRHAWRTGRVRGGHQHGGRSGAAAA